MAHGWVNILPDSWCNGLSLNKIIFWRSFSNILGLSIFLMKSLQIIIFFHARKNDSKLVFSNNLKISFFLLIHPQKWGGKINYDLWTIKKDFQIYGQRLFYSNNSIWCSFPPCVDSVTAAAAADFPGLANRLPAAGQQSRPSDTEVD